MRGLAERRAFAILSGSRGPSSYSQSLSFSSGRGRGRGDGEDAKVPQFGYGAGVGRGSGLGDAGIGRGRGRGSVIPSPPAVSSHPPPFKPFTLGPTQPSPRVAAERPAPSQQVPNQLAEADRNAIRDSRFEDAIIDKPVKLEGASGTPLAVELPAPDVSSDALHGAGRGIVVNKAVPWNDNLKMQPKKGLAAMDTWETRSRLGSSSNQYRGQDGAGRGVPLSQAHVKSSPGATSRNPREAASTAEKARASVWGSLSHILAAPGKPAVRPTPPSPSPAEQQPKQPGAQPQSQGVSPSGVSVESQVQRLPEVAITQVSHHLAEVPTTAEASQVPSIVTAVPEAQLSDASYVAMIKYHQGAGRLAEVDQIYEEMQVDGVHISTPTYNLLIQLYSQSGQFEKMDKVYKQMRQALVQAKVASVQPKNEAVSAPVQPTITPAAVASQRLVQAAAPEVLVTLEEQVVVQASPDLASDQVGKGALITHSDELSARLGEWDSPTSEPAESPSQPTPVEGELAFKQAPLIKPPGAGVETPEDLTPGKLFAQHIKETGRLQSFRGLLNRAPPGNLSEETPKLGSFSPFNLPTTLSPSILGGPAGRGRGAPFPEVGGRAGRGRGAPGSPQGSPQDSIGAEPTKSDKAPEKAIHTELSREQARERAMALLAKGKEAQSQRRATPPPPPSPPRPQLSREDAVQRAVAVMKEGVERNLSREEEKRRRGGAVESFSDAADFVASRFRRRTPDSTSQQARGPQSDKDRFKRQPRFRQQRVEEDIPQVPQTLREMTEEDEKRLMVLEEEEQFKSALHTKFLVDFEPQYAMEYFGINPDIDEKPRMTLAETLAQAKPFLMVEGMTDEQWQGEVNDILEKSPHLEKLVELYAGPDRMTSREESKRLQSLAETMPAHVAPEIQDFMQRALLSLQSNPGIRMKEKERLMGKFVSGLSSF